MGPNGMNIGVGEGYSKIGRYKGRPKLKGKDLGDGASPKAAELRQEQARNWTKSTGVQ
jgi:hypothetical protein